MNKKWTSHIIAMAALTVFIVFGSCVTLTPEEQEAQRAAAAAREAARLTDGKGGIIMINFTIPSGEQISYSVHHRSSNAASRDPWERPGLYGADASKTRERVIVDEDGEYIISFYRRPVATTGISRNSLDWSHKTIYVSNDETVTVNIP